MIFFDFCVLLSTKRSLWTSHYYWSINQETGVPIKFSGKLESYERISSMEYLMSFHVHTKIWSSVTCSSAFQINRDIKSIPISTFHLVLTGLDYLGWALLSKKDCDALPWSKEWFDTSLFQTPGKIYCGKKETVPYHSWQMIFHSVRETSIVFFFGTFFTCVWNRWMLKTTLGKLISNFMPHVTV